MAQHDPVSKQTDVNLQGEAVDNGSFSCELAESHSGPVHVVVVHLLAVPCSSFGISAYWVVVAIRCKFTELVVFWCILIGSWN
jgi:hypothetical protein